MDIQVTCACHKDINPLTPGVNVLDAISAIDTAELEEKTALEAAHDTAGIGAMKERHAAYVDLYKERRYLNKDEYCERLIDYVVAYACKGEVSSTEATEMFKQIIKSDLDESTPFNTLVIKLNNKLVTSKEMPRAEAVFALSGLKLYSSSQQCVNVSLAVGDRSLADGTRPGENETDVGDGEDVPAVRDNAFDKFLKGKADGSLGPSHTFYENIKTSGRVPVFSHGKIRPTWPLTEDYA